MCRYINSAYLLYFHSKYIPIFFFVQITIKLKGHLNIFENQRRIFNCNETLFSLHPKSRSVIAKKGQWNVYNGGGICNKKNMMVLVTGNTVGDIVPPMAVASLQKILLILQHSQIQNGLLGEFPQAG